MLKANELRIGNFIKFHNHLESEKVVTINARFFSSLAGGRSLEEMKPDEELSNYYSGIPLTPEIIENNLGLKKAAETSDEYKIGNIILNLCLYSQGYKVNVFLGGEFLGYHTTVHSLQNLFYSLTQVELKFVW